jgi:baseplate upper protein BppU
MSEATFVQGDTGPDITATLHEFGDQLAILDLTGSTVKFQMRKPDDKRFTVNAAADIVDADAGEVSYSWGPNELAVPGDYQVQWEVTFPDAKVETTDPPNLITVRRQ